MKIEKTLAMKARFTFGTPVGSAPIESRFQRLFAWRFEFLGRCPRLDFEIAPLALRAATGFLKSLTEADCFADAWSRIIGNSLAAARVCA